ncbi:MAG: hypothetical protein OXE52_04460, partial [Chloroflexi bacterium]|nr:hypothetical protein [Chloroflexota bacterium]
VVRWGDPVGRVDAAAREPLAPSAGTDTGKNRTRRDLEVDFTQDGLPAAQELQISDGQFGHRACI